MLRNNKRKIDKFISKRKEVKMNERDRERKRESE